MTYTDAKETALRIANSKFWAYGQGNFDLSITEFAHILFIASNTAGIEATHNELEKYYNKIK